MFPPAPPLSADPDRRGLERGDVRRHRVPGRSEQQRDGVLHLLHRPHTLRQLYPARTPTHCVSKGQHTHTQDEAYFILFITWILPSEYI